MSRESDTHEGAYTIPPKPRNRIDTRPCSKCDGTVEPWARAQDHRLPPLCDACQRANQPPRGTG